MKMKRKTNRAKNTTSGFMKPVPISEEMIKFTGWESCKSRVDVTNLFVITSKMILKQKTSYNFSRFQGKEGTKHQDGENLTIILCKRRSNIILLKIKFYN